MPCVLPRRAWLRRVGAGVLARAAGRAQEAPAALALVNARVWTGNPAQPWAAAIAAASGRILAAGSDQEVRSLAGSAVRVVDAHGASVLPGFIDAHIHLLAFEPPKPYPPLFLPYVAGAADVSAMIAARVAALPAGAWIFGFDWTRATWGGPPPPKSWLDRIAPAHPVWLTAASGDEGFANSLALRAAGIDSDTGLVRGGPMWRVEAALMEGTRERDERALDSAMDRLARHGITSVHHNNSWHQLILFRRAREAGKLRIRIYAAPSFPGVLRLREFIARYGRGDAWLHWGALKGYGAITEARYYPWISEAARAGIQAMVHTGDDAGARALVSVFERVRREQRLADPRFRIEHADDMPADLIPRLAAAGVVVSWQPPLLRDVDMRTRAGSPPPRNLFPCRALLDRGVRIAFGTDSPPGSVSPMESLRLALERRAADGTRITLDEALRAMTADAAYAEFQEREKGTLEPGKLADFVLLDRDLFRAPVERLPEVRVKLTVAGGRVTYEG